jgi:3-oxoacyl-[acyl-carrier-protein] synthase II
MDRFTQFAVAGSKIALEDAAVIMSNANPHRFGVVLGSGVGGIETLEQEYRKLLEKGQGRVSPRSIPMMISNIGSSGHNTSLILEKF